MTPQQADLTLSNPPIFTPAHHEWVLAKAALALADFENTDAQDVPELLRTAYRYRSLAALAKDIQVQIERQQENT